MVSPFDGVRQYIGYEQSPQYDLVGVVAFSEDEILTPWKAGLRSDVIVALAPYESRVCSPKLEGEKQFGPTSLYRRLFQDRNKGCVPSYIEAVATHDLHYKNQYN